MGFPKPIMRRTELEEMGFSKAYLMRIYKDVGPPVAWKNNPGAKNGNSPIIFNTEELEKVMRKGI